MSDTDAYHSCLAVLMQYEGGFDNDPNDPGGATCHGVTHAEYDAYRDGIGQPRRPVMSITMQEVSDIFWKFYWLPLQCQDLPPGLDLCLWDYGVNSGIGKAARDFQRALGVVADGQIGPMTLAAARVSDHAAIIGKLSETRKTFLKSLETFPHFGKGWLARVDDCQRRAVAMAGDAAAAKAGHTSGLAALDPVKPIGTMPPGGSAKAPAPVEVTSAMASSTIWAGVTTMIAALVTMLQQVNALISEAIKAAAGSGLNIKFVTVGLVLMAFAGVWGPGHIMLERLRKMIQG